MLLAEILTEEILNGKLHFLCSMDSKALFNYLREFPRVPVPTESLTVPVP